MVAERDGELTGVSLRASTDVRRSLTKTTVCSICLTSHAGTGVALFVARRAGAAGRESNTVGTYICADLACPLYVRSRRPPTLSTRYVESLTLDEKLQRMLDRLHQLLDQVMLPA